MKSAEHKDWKTKPLPSKRTIIPLDKSFSEENMNYIRKGLIPKEMEDKWFVYWEDDTLFFHRSWTGYCIYIVHFENEQGSYRIISADVNRDPDQYKETREDRDKKMILYLIDILLLHKRAEFPDEKLSGDKQPLGGVGSDWQGNAGVI